MTTTTTRSGTRFDAVARRLAGTADRRAALRLLAAGAAGALGLGAARGGVAADRRYVDRCLRACPDICARFFGSDFDECLSGCQTCCYQGLFGEERSSRCMTAMVICIADPVCSTEEADGGSSTATGTTTGGGISVPDEGAATDADPGGTSSAVAEPEPVDVNTGGQSGDVVESEGAPGTASETATEGEPGTEDEAAS